MSMEVMEHLLKSGRSAVINNRKLKPLEHKLMRGKPLSSQKGQATAFFLTDENGNWWILKKFHSACNLDRNYLNQVSSVLPRTDGFLCGTERQILSRGQLSRSRGCHYSNELDLWLDGTILMPRVNGFDWAMLADEIRDGSMDLDESQRFALCKNLTELIELLENSQCCHRDLSCGNVFVDTSTWQVSLIDFDSLYHPSFTMPAATTCGTTGYTAHQAWNSGNLDPHRTWCPHADRYALALLNVEFLLVGRQTKATGEGGIFDQDELKKQSGKGINAIIDLLKQQHPRMASLLESTIRSNSFSDCPSPQDWIGFYNTVPGLMINPPSLDELQDIPLNHFANLLSKRRPAAPLWPAPNLLDLPLQIPQVSKVYVPKVVLPPDPWMNRN